MFGGVTQGQGLHGTAAERINMTGGIVAAGAAAQSVDMLGDLRTGYLLGASPRVQFIAQAVGSAFSVVLCCGFFVLFANAYPCIIDADAESCSVRIPPFTFLKRKRKKGGPIANEMPSSVSPPLPLGAPSPSP